MANSKFSIEAVDALALLHALGRKDLHPELIEPEVLAQKNEHDRHAVYLGELRFTVSRYTTWNYGASHGTESYTGALDLYPLSSLPAQGATPFSEFYVIPSTLELAETEPATELRSYNAQEARAFLKEYYEDEFDDVIASLTSDGHVIREALDCGMGDEDYHGVDLEFAYPEILHALDEALSDLPQGTFHPATKDTPAHWTIGWPNETPVEIYWIGDKPNDES
jgi:hypothetical protein